MTDAQAGKVIGDGLAGLLTEKATEVTGMKATGIRQFLQSETADIIPLQQGECRCQFSSRLCGVFGWDGLSVPGGSGHQCVQKEVRFSQSGKTVRILSIGPNHRLDPLGEDSVPGNVRHETEFSCGEGFQDPSGGAADRCISSGRTVSVTKALLHAALFLMHQR